MIEWLVLDNLIMQKKGGFFMFLSSKLKTSLLSLVMALVLVISFSGNIFAATAFDPLLEIVERYLSALGERPASSLYVKTIRENNYLDPVKSEALWTSAMNGVSNNPDNFNFTGLYTQTIKNNINYQSYMSLKCLTAPGATSLDFSAVLPVMDPALRNSYTNQWNTRITNISNLLETDMSGIPDPSRVNDLTEELEEQYHQLMMLIVDLYGSGIKVKYRGNDLTYPLLSITAFKADVDIAMENGFKRLINDLSSLFICDNYTTFNTAFNNLFTYDKGANIKNAAIIFGGDEVVALLSNFSDIIEEIKDYTKTCDVKSRLIADDANIYGGSPKSSFLALSNLKYNLFIEGVNAGKLPKTVTYLNPILTNGGWGTLNNKNATDNLYNAYLYVLSVLDPNYEALWIYHNTFMGFNGTLGVSSEIPVSATYEFPYRINTVNVNTTQLAFYVNLKEHLEVSENLLVPTTKFLNFKFYDENNNLITTTSTTGNRTPEGSIDIAKLGSRTGTIKILVERIHSSYNSARDYVGEFYITIFDASEYFSLTGEKTSTGVNAILNNRESSGKTVDVILGIYDQDKVLVYQDFENSVSLSAMETKTIPFEFVVANYPNCTYKLFVWQSMKPVCEEFTLVP